MTFNTIVESPARKLRRELGLPDIPAGRSRPRVDDWFKLSTGDIVREKDGRHWGRVEGWTGMNVRIKWLDSGHQSTLHRDAITTEEEN